MTFNEYTQSQVLPPTVIIAATKFKQSMLEYFPDGELKLLDQRKWEPYWDFYMQGVNDAFDNAL